MGGQNIYVAKQLAERGLDVDIDTRCDDPHLPEVVPIGTRVRRTYGRPRPPADVLKEPLLPYTVACMDAMIARVRREPDRVDAMHTNFFMSGDAALRVKWRLGMPFVTTFHALGGGRRLRQGAADGFPDARFAIEHTFARRSDHLIAECPQNALDLIAHYRADKTHIEMRAARFRSSGIPAGAAHGCGAAGEWTRAHGTVFHPAPARAGSYAEPAGTRDVAPPRPARQPSRFVTFAILCASSRTSTGLHR